MEPLMTLIKGQLFFRVDCYVVRYAKLCKPSDAKLKFQILLHGTDLQTLSIDGQMMIDIYQATIFRDILQWGYL